MEREKSLKILNDCAEFLEKISDDEFLRILAEKGILNKNYELNDQDESFQIILPAQSSIFENQISIDYKAIDNDMFYLSNKQIEDKSNNIGNAA